MPSTNPCQIIIIGGGFAGLAAARALARAPVQVTLVDRRNHHVFQPLLYQVATAALSPADIAAPIRTILRGQHNCQVALAQAVGIDPAQHRLLLDDGSMPYDYLVLAAGATHDYFGHDDWAGLAPGLKTIEDALELRRRILLTFESAEQEAARSGRPAQPTFGIVGAGPTGVELAGAIKEIAGLTLPRDYRHIDTRSTRVLLFEYGDRVLPQFDAGLSARALRDLEALGVEVRLRSQVTGITREGVHVRCRGQDGLVPLRTVFWAAGVRASPLARSLDVPLDRAGRVLVEPDLSVPGRPEIFVAGDLAAARSADTGQTVPGVAQAAIQMGRHAGRMIARQVTGQAGARPGFVYKDKGSAAVIGKARAVVHRGWLRCSGFPGWILWGAIHISFLVGFRNRLYVLLSWFWNWLLDARDARLITGPTRIEPEPPRRPESATRGLDPADGPP